MSSLSINPHPESTSERQLAAIVAADVVGYSRLMEDDEEATLVQLRDLRRDLIDPKAAQHHGRIFKTMGDGVLIEFASVIDAVRFAVDLQQELRQKPASALAAPPVRMRIGINIGDVFREGDDVFGDGVNVAARLEGLADPGGIAVSRAVRDAVRERFGLDFEYLGPRTVKNISRPIHVYQIVPERLAGAPAPASVNRWWRWMVRFVRLNRAAVAVVAVLVVLLLGSVGTARWWPRSPGPAAREGVSLVVLPFRNSTGSAEQQYLADGLTEEITSYIARAPDTLVIASTTAFTYRDRAVDTRTVGRELGVRYVLTGGVQTVDTGLRVSVQLADAETNQMVWSDTIERTRGDTSGIQEDVARGLADALRRVLVSAESQRSLRERASNPDSMDLTLRARALLNQPYDHAAALAAREMFDEALKLNPRNVAALTGKGHTYMRVIELAWNLAGRDADLDTARRLAEQALQIDKSYAPAHFLMAAVHARSGEYEAAVAEQQSGLALDPSYASGYNDLGVFERHAGRPEAHPKLVDEALRISPHDPYLPYWLNQLGVSQIAMGQYEEAIATLRRAVGMPNASPFLWSNMAGAHLALGQVNEARQALTRNREIRPDLAKGSVEEQLTRLRVQLALSEKGAYTFSLDGEFGPQTRRAIRRFQSRQGLEPTGELDDETLSRLGIRGPVP